MRPLGRILALFLTISAVASAEPLTCEQLFLVGSTFNRKPPPPPSQLGNGKDEARSREAAVASVGKQRSFQYVEYKSLERRVDDLFKDCYGPSCSPVFLRAEELSIVDLNSVSYLVNKVAVTSHVEYSLERTLNALDIRGSDLQDWSISHLKVLSVGEGAGALLPAMRQLGIDAYAMDLWYGRDFSTFALRNKMARIMTQFQRDYSDRLIPGNILRPPQHLVGKFDRVVSHRLLNNLDANDAVMAVKQMMTLLKPGGSLITEISDRHVAQHLSELGFRVTNTKLGYSITKRASSQRDALDIRYSRQQEDLRTFAQEMIGKLLESRIH